MLGVAREPDIHINPHQSSTRIAGPAQSVRDPKRSASMQMKKLTALTEGTGQVNSVDYFTQADSIS